MAAWGVSHCSSRSEGGTTPLHTRLEALVAEFLGVEDAITYGMGFATNSASIPALCGERRAGGAGLCLPPAAWCRACTR